MSTDANRPMLKGLDKNTLERLYVREQQSTLEIAKIARTFGVSFKEMFFIDDILGHLTLAATLGVYVVLASWGYSNRQQLSEAKEKGIPYP